MNITSIEIHPVISDKGLIAFANIQIDDILLNSIAVYRKLNGGLRLLYPTKNGKTLFHPLNKDMSLKIEAAIFNKIRKAKGCEYGRYSDPTSQ